MANNKKKINWLLILQGWTMLWVVIGHAFLGEAGNGPNWENALFHFAYSFHMPLFILISGWLFFATRLTKKVDGREYTYSSIIKDKTVRLLLPGLFFSVFAFGVKLLFPGEVARQAVLSFNDISHAYLYPIDNPFLELWFIVVLFILFLCFPLWKFVIKNKITMWIMMLILLVLHYYHPQTKFLSIDRVCEHALWFYIGILLCKEDIVELLFKKKPVLIIITGIALFGVGCYLPILRTMGGIILSIGVALLADNYVPRLFFSYRDYTYQIFLMGIFAQVAIKMFYKNVDIPYLMAFILCILAGVYVPVLISKIVEKINWRPLLLCMGLK